MAVRMVQAVPVRRKEVLVPGSNQAVVTEYEAVATAAAERSHTRAGRQKMAPAVAVQAPCEKRGRFTTHTLKRRKHTCRRVVVKE